MASGRFWGSLSVSKALCGSLCYSGVPVSLYTATVLAFCRDLFWAYIALSAGTAVTSGYVAATDSASPRKGKAVLICTLSFSSFFFVVPFLWSLYERSLPVFQFDGVITQVSVHSHSSRHYSAQLGIATADGGKIEMHVSDSSSAWRVGQRLRGTYFGDTGDLIRVTLIGPDGRAQGIVRRSAPLTRLLSISLGLFLSWAAFKKFRSDPEGLFEGQRKAPSPDGVDGNSLLHLSDKP